MDIAQLRHFLAVTATGSFGGAAEQLGLTQSGVSRSILALEAAIGLPLFDRRPRGVELTEFGRALLPRARALLNDRDCALRELRTFHDLEKGSVTIGLMPIFAYTLGPLLAARVLNASAGIDIRMVTATHETLTTLLQGADIHCALVLAIAPEHPELDYKRLGTVNTAVFTSPRHPLTQYPDLTIAALQSDAWALTESRSLRIAFDAYFRSRDLSPPQVRLTCPSIALLIQVMQYTPLLTVLPRELEHSSLVRQRLQLLDIAAPASDAHAWLVTRRGQPIGPALELALKTVTELR